MKPDMRYFIKYQAGSLDIIKEFFPNFVEYCDRLEYLENKATNILDYGVIGE